ncbi:hypothetical protein PGSY75_0723200 [Plasmodium gaboni]|uniref:DUF8019 domain-containing protein n=1 Tax=Plasmodium gaboni TaxID=647221 RepID=A0A151LQ88_9APIC|nr:hypothetical protein PGSY75_0723200 [Plasmodium gaboni]KYO01371.1 hypothetical protein PGSY75_0723200 [Plasmodium gaboni]SOV22017.1 conserved Plasmodium protein, unknown function [Plasmodium sp. DRC-Itaito]
MKMKKITLFVLFYFMTAKLCQFEKSLFNYLGEVSFIEPFEHLFEKCLEIPNTICLGGTGTIITPHSFHKGLIGKWTFDDMYAIDYSSYNNHMHKYIRPGPGFNGHGYSGAFIGDVSGFVPSSDSLKTTEFTIVFWIYLLERSTSHFRNIISQIDKEKDTKIAILLHAHITKLSVRVLGFDNYNEGLSSFGYIPLRRWTNVIITLNNKEIAIYINGIFDNSVSLKSKVVEKSGDLTVGKNMNYSGFNGYLDELYFYNTSLSISEIKSFSLPSVTGIYDTDYVYVGNYNCNYNTAISSNLCKKNYRLCSLNDLYNGGAIHYARINGILIEKSNLWTWDISETSFEKDEKRIALCCKTYEE